MHKAAIIIPFAILVLAQAHQQSENKVREVSDEYTRFQYVDSFEYISYSSVDIRKRSLSKRSLNSVDLSTIQAADSFLLELYGYNTTFCLHLNPNSELFHDKLKKNQKFSALPFKGFVMAAIKDGDFDTDYECSWSSITNASQDPKWQDDWARMIVHANGKRFKSYDYRPFSPVSRDLSLFDEIRKELEPEIQLFEGAFVYRGEMYLVKTIDGYHTTRGNLHRPVEEAKLRHPHHAKAELVIYTRSDLKTYSNIPKEEEHQHSACGMENTEWNSRHAKSYVDNFLKLFQGSGDQSPVPSSGSLTSELHLGKRAYSGCPTAKKILYTGVVMDCTYIARYADTAAAQAQVILNWNVVSEIYERTYNIFIGLLDMVPMDVCTTDLSKLTSFNRACSSGYTITNRLSDFSKWRGTELDDGAGLWHLMSNCSTGATIGIAWLNMVCQSGFFDQTSSAGTEYVSGTGVSTFSNAEFMTIAHEMGHNFGASHDCTTASCSTCGNLNSCSNCCACSGCDCQNAFIMNPTSDVSTTNPRFSPCSQTTVCNKNQLFGQCLEEPGSKPVFNGGICGNGVRESEEECDCGSNCATDTCCFANCTLKAGAFCSDSNDGCCRNCNVIPAAAKFECRAQAGECDVSEICDGDKSCPDDLFKENGLICGNTTGLTCASGVCTSRTAQCQAYRDDAISACSSYNGLCSMFCDTQEDGCIKVAGAFFLDGTPCGSGGVCQNKKCSKPDAFASVTEWILTHQNVAIFLVLIISVLMFVLGNIVIRNMKPEKDSNLIRQAQLQENELARLQQIDRQQKVKARKAREMAASNRGAANSDARKSVARPSNRQSLDPEQGNTAPSSKRESVQSVKQDSSKLGTSYNAGKGGGRSYDPRSPIAIAEEGDSDSA